MNTHTKLKCTNRLGWYITLALLIFLTGIINQQCDAKESNPPNVIVLLADDAGWGDYSFNGNQSVRTPSIDSIARNGVSFDRFFVCSVCAPTRAEFLTGRYHPRCGVRGVSLGEERMNLDEQTIANHFKTFGYSTGIFGKWHNGSQWPYHPMARGFDEFYGYTSGHWGEYFNPPIEHNGKMIREKGYIVDLCTDKAIEFIRTNKDKPFFCFVPFTTPHSPWSAPLKNWNENKSRTLLQRATNRSEEIIEQTRCAYAMIENQDENVGRILRTLDDLNLDDKTIVVYFSDNGPNTARWNGGMKGRKGSTDEGGIRSPLFIRWSGNIKPNMQVNQIAGAIDLLPTLTQLAGVEFQSKMKLDGSSLVPLIRQEGTPWPERLLFSHHNGQISVRSQRFRLDSKSGLFDMATDPFQSMNVASKMQDTSHQLNHSVEEWKRDVFPESSILPQQGSNAIIDKMAKDDRPFPVGYPQFPWTQLPARDGNSHGGVKRSSSAPNSSYFVNWKSIDDSISWDIDVFEEGDYEVSIDYTCPVGKEGSTIDLTFLESRIATQVATSWDPPLITDQDTIPRPPAESIMKEFRPLNIGTMHLPRGRGLMTLKASKIPNGYVMDVLRLNLTLLVSK